MSADAGDILDRLQRNLAWLRKTARNAEIAGMDVTIQKPAVLIEDLEDASAAIERLTGECTASMDEIARERERADKAEDECQSQFRLVERLRNAAMRHAGEDDISSEGAMLADAAATIERLTRERDTHIKGCEEWQRRFTGDRYAKYQDAEIKLERFIEALSTYDAMSKIRMAACRGGTGWVQAYARDAIRAALAPEGKPPLIGAGISDETRAALAEIDEAQRAAAMAASSIIVGAPERTEGK